MQLPVLVRHPSLCSQQHRIAYRCAPLEQHELRLVAAMMQYSMAAMMQYSIAHGGDAAQFSAAVGTDSSRLRCRVCSRG